VAFSFTSSTVYLLEVNLLLQVQRSVVALSAGVR
jgi:hypothetical protein